MYLVRFSYVAAADLRAETLSAAVGLGVLAHFSFTVTDPAGNLVAGWCPLYGLRTY